ncbi:MAG: hypothetical protein ACJ8C4_20785 [Gemmataceae bacterium]
MKYLIAASLVFLVGCGGPPASNAPQAKVPANSDVALRVVKWPEFETILAAQRGKILVLDIWADY